MVEPGGLVAVFRSVVVDSDGAVVRRGRSTDGFDIGFRSRGANLAAGGVDGGKLLRMLAIAKSRLFVSEEGIGTQTGRVVTFGGIVAEADAVKVDATIQLEKDVFRGAVSPGQDGEWGSAFHHRNFHPVGEGDHVGGGIKAAVGQAVRIVGRVTVGTVLAGAVEGGTFHSVLIERDGGVGPKRGKFGGSVAENVVAPSRDNDRAQFITVFVKPGLIRSVWASGILIQISISGKTRAEVTGHPGSSVVVEHDHHGDIWGSC